MYGLARVEQLTLRELLQFRMIIEGNAYRLAAQNRTDAAPRCARARADRHVGRASRAASEAFTDADLGFHDVVAEAADNKLLSISISVVRDIVGPPRPREDRRGRQQGGTDA